MCDCFGLNLIECSHINFAELILKNELFCACVCVLVHRTEKKTARKECWMKDNKRKYKLCWFFFFSSSVLLVCLFCYDLCLEARQRNGNFSKQKKKRFRSCTYSLENQTLLVIAWWSLSGHNWLRCFVALKCLIISTKK